MDDQATRQQGQSVHPCPYAPDLRRPAERQYSWCAGYVTGDKAAVVIPRSLSAARDFLKQGDKTKLPSNHHLYDLLAQAEVVEADENRQCVKRIRVAGKHGPVELYALIFATSTVIPQAILPTLPKVTFELVPEEPSR